MKKNSVTKNAMWIILCKVLQSLFGMVISMISARYLGPSNYGLINYAASITAFVLPIMQLGFRSILVQEIVDNPDKEGEVVGTAIFFNILSAVVCVIGIVSFVYIANPNERVTLVVCALYSISLLAQALEMVQYWFQAKLLSQYSSIIGLIAYLVVTVYKIYLLATKKSVYWFAISFTLDCLIIAVILLSLFNKLCPQKLKISWKRFLTMFSKSRYFIVSSLMVTVFSQTDKIMLKMMLTSETVGIYSAAMVCAGISSFVFAAIIDSFRPVVFECKKKSEKEYENSLINCYSIVIYLSLAQSLFFFMCSGFIVNTLYGVEYAQSAIVLRVAVWYTTFSYMGPIRNMWMLAENKQKHLWVVNLSGALVNILLNMVLIPIYGVMGAAIASLITQVFTNFIIGFIFTPIKYNNLLIFKALNPVIVWRKIKFIKDKIIYKN